MTRSDGTHATPHVSNAEILLRVVRDVVESAEGLPRDSAEKERRHQRRVAALRLLADALLTSLARDDRDGKALPSEPQAQAEEFARLVEPLVATDASLAEALRDLFQALSAPPPQEQRGSTNPETLPDAIPQPTSQEVREMLRALTDGPRLRNWLPIDGETALRHVLKDSPLQTKLEGGALLGWLGLPNTTESLQGVVQRMGLDAGVLLCVCLGAILEQRNRTYFTVTLDALIDKIGWDPRSTVQREGMRRDLWQWMLAFSAMPMIGCRPGKYKGRDGKMLDLTSRDPLLVIAGTRQPVQQSFDGSTPPLEVTLGPGAWLDQYRGDRRIATYLGDVCKVAAIPGGKPSGRWARSIGLALHQLWREAASDAIVGHNGENNTPTIRLHRPLTRRQLLNLFLPEPPVEELLKGSNPIRAKRYWSDAVEILKQAGIIGACHELAPLGGTRKGWEDDWLDQPLDIRPTADTISAIADIARNTRAARKARSSRKPRLTLTS